MSPLVPGIPPEQTQEDSAHATGEGGTPILGVRNDADATVTDADGDYSVVSVDDAGRLKIAGTVSVSEPVSVDDNGGSLTVDGPLTDAELRAAPVEISDGGGSITVDGTVSVSEPVSVDDNGGSLTVDGPLTDTELRAAPVPVSGTVSVTEPVSIDDNGSTISIDDGGASITVDGPLTDTELRASPVPVSGTVTADAGVGPWPVTDNGGSLTVDGTVNIGTIPEVEVKNDAGSALSVTDATASVERKIDGAGVSGAGLIVVPDGALSFATTVKAAGSGVTINGPDFAGAVSLFSGQSIGHSADDGHGNTLNGPITITTSAGSEVNATWVKP